MEKYFLYGKVAFAEKPYVIEEFESKTKAEEYIEEHKEGLDIWLEEYYIEYVKH